MQLKNKNILIISPNYWGNMMVSKHHYAIELARRGNTVYFLNPPNLKKKYFELSQIRDNLFLIDYKPIFRAKSYLPYSFFNFLVKLQAIFLIKKIINKPDIIWSFDSSLYLNLKWFSTKFNIFFLADSNENRTHHKISESADLVLSVSQIMLNELKGFAEKTYFINHGLSNDSAVVAERLIENSIVANSKKEVIQVCYIGNLLIKSLDRVVCKDIIASNSHINFTFYGAYQLDESNLSGDNSNETNEFIEFLKLQENVVLKGTVTPSNIGQEIGYYDAFLVLINPENDYNKGANSHKIMEYLSTGKVVIANHLSTYKDKRDLIEMVDEMHNKKLPTLFKNVISNLDHYNSPELQKKRIEFALDNTYEKQIKRIEAFINKVISN